MTYVRMRFPWEGTREQLEELLTPLSEAVEAQDKPEPPDIDVVTDAIVTADYSSINALRDCAEPWIDLWSGDEWGESMQNLLGATHTSYGFDDEDCARMCRILWNNLAHQREWMEDEGKDYGLYEPEDEKRAIERARKAREYWSKGGNITSDDSIAKAKATLDSLPGWVFGEELS